MRRRIEIHSIIFYNGNIFSSCGSGNEHGGNMENIFISDITIENVRHLKNITIPLSDKEKKHLIFTGKNGSGKTSVLEAMSDYLNIRITSEETADIFRRLSSLQDPQTGQDEKRWIKYQEEELEKTGATKTGVKLRFNHQEDLLRDCFGEGEFILAFYKAERTFHAYQPNHIEKVELKGIYTMEETPRQEFIKYLADLKVTEALAKSNGKHEKADAITLWFAEFQDLLRRIFDDPSLELIFEEDTFSFSIKEKNREAFDFNTLASGFAAALDIILDVMIRMQKNKGRTFNFDMPGIVLIDEIETHLHLELQKKILDLLTTLFPNIQFIMSTHSPFILNSLQNAVIYDLEKRMIAKDGLADIPYSGIVEGYFQSSELSYSLKEKYERYKMLTQKQELSDDDFEEIAELEMYLNEIPDYLALGITTEYQRIKMEFENREDL